MATRQIKAEDTSHIFGRGPSITDRSEMVGIQYLVTSWEHDEDSEKTESESLRPGRASVFGEDGFLWGSGPISMEIPSEKGFLDILQPLLNDPTPVSTPIPKKTLVAADTNLESIVAAGYFTDTADETLKIVDEQVLTGSGDKTIAEALNLYQEALTLTVTPDGDADLTAANTPGTISITYTDADGETQTTTLSFGDTVKTTAQTPSLPAGATLTRIRSTGWKAGKFSITTVLDRNIVRNPEPDRPGQLRVKYTGDLADHTLLIRGVRRVGLASDDTLPMREKIELGANVLTEKYFHKINKVEVKDNSGADVASPKGKIEIISEPGGYETTLKVANDDPDGLTFEARVGGEPWVVTRGIFIGGNIEIGDTISATFEMLSNRVDKRRTIENRDDEQFTSTMDQHTSEFPLIERRFYSGYGRFLELDGEAVLCNSVGVNIAHNYDFVQGKVPGRFRRDTEPNARRLTTASVNTNYESGSSEEDTFIRWDEKFRNNESVDARVATYQWLGNGRQLSISYRMRNCEIQSPVRVAASSPGTVPVDVDLKAVPPDGQTDGEIEVIIMSDDQWK